MSPKEKKSPLKDFASAEQAFARNIKAMDQLALSDLATVNVDLVSAASIVLGVSDRVLAFRSQIASLPDFDITHVDRLVDYALGAWYCAVTNLPTPQSTDIAALTQEAQSLRAKLLMWAAPLAGSGYFEEAAVARIREGSGTKDTASDLIALVGLYRASWDSVKSIVGVTDKDLARASQLGLLVFALVSKRENQAPAADGSIQVRRAFTLLDRAYSQCRRAIQYFRFNQGDADLFAPSLRRNNGGGRRESAEPKPPDEFTPPAAPVSPGPIVGGNGSPFITEP
jgi:hypothetical protein